MADEFDEEDDGFPEVPIGPVDQTREEGVSQFEQDVEKFSDPSRDIQDFLPPDAEPGQPPVAEAAVDVPSDEGHFLEAELQSLPDFDSSAEFDSGTSVDPEAQEIGPLDLGDLPDDQQLPAPQGLLEAFQRPPSEPGHPSNIQANGLPQMPQGPDDGAGGTDLSGIVQTLADEGGKSLSAIGRILQDLTRQVQSITEALERMRL